MENDLQKMIHFLEKIFLKSFFDYQTDPKVGVKKCIYKG